MVIEDDVFDGAEKALGYTFKDRTLLAKALTHASIADARLDSNERLEFLGDAVLGFVVCEALYKRFDDLLEGDLTKIKSAVVSRRQCARIARMLELDKFLVLGKGMRARAQLPGSLSAAVYESVIGAIFLDGGIRAARTFIMKHMAEHIEAAASSGHQHNFKSVLQQHAQTENEPAPEYIMLDEQGPDHAKAFQVCVQMGGRRYEPCWSASKKQAEQDAALIALRSLGLIQEDNNGRVLYVPEGEGSE